MAKEDEKDQAQTADGGAGAEDIVKADPGTVPAENAATGASPEGVAEAMKEAQAIQRQNAEAMVSARDLTTPDATYVRGTPGANVNVAAPAGAPVISTYEDALEAGYFGVAPGHANTEGLSVAAVTERDRKLGLAGTRGVKGAVVNGNSESADNAVKDDRK